MSTQPRTSSSATLGPGIRTYKPRRSRITRREQAALVAHDGLLLTMVDDTLALPWPSDTPLVLDIGFGSGESTLAMARNSPTTAFLAIDIHTPGVGKLIADIHDTDLTNVRVMEADALTVLERVIPHDRLAGVCSFFPDPWPKARHHKRRLIQPSVVALMHSRLASGGFWRIATDWPDYADAIRGTFATHDGFTGGVIDRPEYRALTHYERRALREGRAVTDFEYLKV